MTTHAAIKTANRTALPRALLGRRRTRVYLATEFRFAAGDTVAFGDHVASIMTRSRSAIGREMYYIQLITGDMAGRPFRTVEGSHLTACRNPYE
ncbi:hypothetical protein HF206_06440 [Rhizobium leguminosarum]|uniref:hypothetical protein n=1 Tax=Rhizobium leguminosarum TaxID=384 RepID=UPI001C926E4E|nr:hypothetical protein [Rhizobium leguminosarum]MBY2913761.1 hypothetical protein [Rhizobium leguminosarum]MBY2976671.1 hypothetical protein [Rhizobium leguminosarum]MBY3005222.1 hypothetical protein [Rhizobium leguminosarum]